MEEAEMRVIRKGDTVVISKTVNIQWYKDSEVGWEPSIAEHLGKSGKVVLLGQNWKGDKLVAVRVSDKRLGLSKAFWWSEEDVSLFLSSKWRRRHLGKEK